MSQTQALPNNFRQRNRIVAGMSDATILVESAYKGGGLITCRIAQEYGHDVFAFPGAVGMPCSEGCNKAMVEKDTATLNYYSAEHEQMDIKVDGNHATLTGRSRVNAAVFGGGRHTWRLQLYFQLSRYNGHWLFTNAQASTY